MAGMFRLLRADEIDVRVSRDSKTNGVSVLLYKDARCDMNILDETVGPQRWQRSHSRDNANCVVSIFFDGIGWVTKEDTGTESNTEAAKGLASDSFKRACFNWGIGRELYTSPKNIKIEENKLYRGKDGKCYTSFSVSAIEYDDNQEICALTIVDAMNGKTLYDWKGKKRVFKPTGGSYEAESDSNQSLAQKVENIAKPVNAPKPVVTRSEPKGAVEPIKKEEISPEQKAAEELSAYKNREFSNACKEFGMRSNELLKNANELIRAGYVSSGTEVTMKDMNRQQFDELLGVLRSNFSKQ